MSTYKIKEGNHYANGLHFGVHFGITEQKYRVKFSKECLYQPLDWENDWNKLCGWSYGMHHNNSIRVCWRPSIPVNYIGDSNFTSNLIELCIYVYEDGVRKISEKTIIVDIEKTFELYIYRIGNIIALSKNYKSTNYIRLEYATKPSLGYRLYPYFGGTNPASKDMAIELERL